MPIQMFATQIDKLIASSLLSPNEAETYSRRRNMGKKGAAREKEEELATRPVSVERDFPVQAEDDYKRE